MKHHTVLVIASVIVLTASGCTPESHPGPPAQPDHVTLTAPDTANEAGQVVLTIDSQGHHGETVQLYQFHVGFDETSTCTDTKTKPIPIDLLGGEQTVTLTAGEPGDIWWMLSSGAVIVNCGQAKTRVLAYPEAGLNFRPYDGPYGATVKVGEPFSYRVFGVPRGHDLTGTASWVGPFKTAPEANMLPCPEIPIAMTDSVVLGHDAPQKGVSYPFIDFTHVIDSPGIYRVLLAITATPTTAAWKTPCDEAQLVIVQ